MKLLYREVWGKKAGEAWNAKGTPLPCIRLVQSWLHSAPPDSVHLCSQQIPPWCIVVFLSTSCQMPSSGKHIKPVWLNHARRTGDLLDEQYIKSYEELRRELLKICPNCSPGLQKKKVKIPVSRFNYCSLIYLISANWAVLNAWMWCGSLEGKGPLDLSPSCFFAGSLLGSKFVTSKNGKRKEHDQSSEIRGLLSYVHLKDGQVAKPETQKLVTYE